MDVQVSLYRLLTDTLHFSEFTIDGLYLDVNLNEQDPVIGGFVIASNSNDTIVVDESKDVEKNQANDEPNNYLISLPKFKLSNAVFNIGIEQSLQEFAVSSLVIENVLASTKAQKADISLNALINKTPLLIEINAQLVNNMGEISSELVLSELALAPLQPFLKALGTDQDPLKVEGSISINSKQLVSITETATKINLKTFELITDSFKATQQNKTLALNIAPLSLEEVSVELINEQAPNVKGTAKLNINNIIAYDGKESQVLANISAINLDKISITTSESVVSANIPNFIIEQSIFAEDTLDEHQPLAKISKPEP